MHDLRVYGGASPAAAGGGPAVAGGGHGEGPAGRLAHRGGADAQERRGESGINFSVTVQHLVRE